MALAERAPALVGRLVDQRYRVRRHIAEGGMASVYLAIDERLDRPRGGSAGPARGSTVILRVV